MGANLLSEKIIKKGIKMKNYFLMRLSLNLIKISMGKYTQIYFEEKLS